MYYGLQRSYMIIASTVRAVLARQAYAMIAGIISITVGSAFWFLTFALTPTPFSEYIKAYGLPFTTATILLGFMIAALTGVNASMVICRKQMTGNFGFKKDTTTNACSVFTGTAVSGCPLCTMPILGIFGLGGSLAFFPLLGLEFKILAIIALLVSTYYTAKNVKITCKM